MAGAGGRWYILACVTADKTQTFSIGVFLFFRTILPSFAFFPPITWAVIIREERRRSFSCWVQVFLPDAAGCDFSSCHYPRVEQALHCLTSNTWPQWVLWARFNSWRRPANEFTFLFSMHIRKMSISHHKWCKWCSTSVKKTNENNLLLH